MKSSCLVLGSKSDTFNDDLKSATHRYHQMQSIFPGDALPGLSFSVPVFFWGIQFLQSCSQKVKSMSNWVQDGWLPGPVKNTPLLGQEKLLGCLSSMSGVIVLLQGEGSATEFWCLWIFGLDFSRQGVSVQSRIHPTVAVISHIINKENWASSSGSHACASHSTTIKHLFVLKILKACLYELSSRVFHMHDHSVGKSNYLFFKNTLHTT